MVLVDALGLGLDALMPDVVALVGAGGKSSALFALGREIAARGQRVLLTTTTHLSYDQVQAAPSAVTVDGPSLPWAEIGACLDRVGQCLLMGPPGGPRRQGLTPAQVDALAAAAPRLNVAALIVEADGSRLLPLKAPAAHEPVLPASTTVLVPVLGIDALGQRLNAATVHRPERVAAVLEIDDAVRLTPAMLATLALHPAGGAKAKPAAACLVPLINKVERADQLAAARWMAARWAGQGVRSVIAALGAADGPRVRERWAPWAVVVLAAGGSSRLGAPKQLLPVAGEALVRRAVRTALASGATQVVLVTGAAADAVVAALGDCATDARVQIVHNAEWARGQAGSMHTGLAALSAAIPVAVFLPVDQPFVPATLLRRLMGAWRAGADLAAPEVDGEMRGAPALFDRSFWPALHLVRGDMGGRMILRANAHRVHLLPTPGDLLRDVDTPADLAALTGDASAGL